MQSLTTIIDNNHQEHASNSNSHQQHAVINNNQQLYAVAKNMSPTTRSHHQQSSKTNHQQELSTAITKNNHQQQCHVHLHQVTDCDLCLKLGFDSSCMSPHPADSGSTIPVGRV